MTLELKNIIEDIVEKKVNELTVTLSTCPCERCKKDAIAYSLNRIRPHYVVSEAGDLMAKVHHSDLQDEAAITSTVVQAVMTVNKHPHHSRIEKGF